MKKSFLNTRLKNILYAPLLLLLTASMAITGVSAQGEPYLYVDPTLPVVISAPGENATIEVKIFNVTDCYGVDFWLYYNSTLLSQLGGVDIHGPFDSGNPPIRPDPATYPGGYMLTEISAPGVVRVSLTFVGAVGAPSFNGTGTVAAITFNGTMVGVSDLTFDETKVKIYNRDGSAKPRDPCVGGTIDVRPEFPAAIIVPLLLTVTLAAATLGKMFWSRKRKGPANE